MIALLLYLSIKDFRRKARVLRCLDFSQSGQRYGLSFVRESCSDKI